MRLSLNSRKALPRRTRERELILDRVQTLPGHFRAEQLWLALEREGQRVARATVYRTLELLVEQGILQRVQLDEGGAMYELQRGRAAHAHLFCLGCGKLSDYHLPTLSRLPRQVRQSRGFRAEHLLLRVCGYCRECGAEPKRRNAVVEARQRKKIRKPALKPLPH
jgi:Fur family ferric uptake transcriptional regulator